VKFLSPLFRFPHPHNPTTRGSPPNIRPNHNRNPDGRLSARLRLTFSTAYPAVTSMTSVVISGNLPAGPSINAGWEIIRWFNFGN
jgi:hypothetical protein